MLMGIILFSLTGTIYILLRPRQPIRYRKSMRTILRWVVNWLVLALGIGMATLRVTAAVQLEIQLRASDGTAVEGEVITLQRLPEGTAVSCTTDARGLCAWPVTRGLYQVTFSRPLDAVSAAALAEGGLDGLGLTVGDGDIRYAFTFQEDGYVYFDAAPKAAVPQPQIPDTRVLQAATSLLGSQTPETAVPYGEIFPVVTQPVTALIQSATGTRPVVAGLSPTSTLTISPIPMATAVPLAAPPALHPSARLPLLAACLGLIGGAVAFWLENRREQRQEGRD